MSDVPRPIGFLLTAAAAVLIVTLVLHPPPPPDAAEFMQVIADEGSMWSVVHWLAAAGLTLMFVISLLVLNSRSHLTSSSLTQAAWALLGVACLLTVSTAIMEATVMPGLAAEGDLATFSNWNDVAGGMAMGFLLYGVSVAAIGFDQSRNARSPLPSWAGRIVIPFGIMSTAGWALRNVFDVAAGGAIWLIATLLVNVWLVSFGIALVRAPTPQTRAQSVEA